MDIKDTLLKAMETYFDGDQKRISHAKKVLSFAEQIMSKEGGDKDVIIASAILHDIGIHNAEKKYNSTAGKYQEIEGSPIAKKILEIADFPDDKIAEVLDIIAHHHSGGLETINFKIIWDSDWLVNIKEDDKLNINKKRADKIFFTDIAKKIYSFCCAGCPSEFKKNPEKYAK
ncbi:hypothetical protein A3J90_05300 [candidate division WOR-1 bacterium RIFOXYC2_FULL_37_10]|uniref:HD domain-containing protein n=1 Tax=candidate division WOR-1 bacterium RIFOXYB2_FULL_37_13 TaxID=1802579 RepID=A0A1F4SHL0_UNCSA|nr:MAG: hypothetical protein A2246_03345 [candidate division WOR-1 bacterium RIFOXYA2_FULL_37_7]OGC19922.1 MAG: hypothetical protein A2310_08830 [candidate division WOR-1 bacterium RIFOXYB2_FULL_37_13]OGC35160.1 MAG: hypothetical protein A3J90_05300 [candidate division WOR-1 bacterium RIFOXYC2_FULL_37_10]